MKNRIVRTELFKQEVTQSRLAKALGMHEQSLSRKLRYELPKEEQLKMVELVKEIAEKKHD